MDEVELSEGGEVSLSVVIPARNSARFIARALNSVQRQTLQAAEVIVVDDGSSDGTGDRAAESSATGLIVTGPRGVAAARNSGVEASTSDFVAFLDADDYWDEDHLQRMTDAIRATDRRAVLYFSDMRIAPERGGRTLWEHCGFRIGAGHELVEQRKDWLFLERQPILLQASVVNRAAYLSVGGSDPTLPRRSDTHLIFKLGLSGPMCAVAGAAGELTAENKHSLTAMYNPETSVYEECTLRLYRDLLRNAGAREREQRRAFRQRGAAAARWLARDVGLRKPGRAASYLVRALAASPHGTTTAVARAIVSHAARRLNWKA